MVIALGLMAFVLLLLLSITTLVQVETQSAAITKERLQAEQNAYLGLQVAIGELQKHAGVDQRITARSDLIADTVGAPTAAPSRKYYTGVWDSQTGVFQKWLASVADGNGQSDPGGLLNELDVNNAATGTTTIALMKVPGNAAEDVLVDQVQVDDTGAYAFWIADEGVKAKVDLVNSEVYYDALEDGDEEAQILRAPLGAAPGFGVQVLTGFSSAMALKQSDPALRENLRKITQNDELELLGVAATALGTLRHDLTTVSYGLLTNPKDGGLKEDLSLAFEHGNKDSGNVFTVENYAHPSGTDIDVRGPSWALFQDHYNLYKQMSYTNGIPQLDTNDPVAHGLLSGSDQDNFYSHRDSNKKVYMDVTVFPDAEAGGSIQAPPGSFELPRPVRVQRQPISLGSMVIISMYNDAGKLVTILNPVALMWNPYNTALRLHTAATVKVPMMFGVEYLFKDPAGVAPEDVDLVPYKGRISTKAAAPRSSVSLGINAGETFEPGEIKLYTVGDARTTSATPTVVNEINYSNGYYITKWLEESRLGNVLQQDITRPSYYTTDGLDMPLAGSTVQIAVTPIQTNWHDSSYAPTSTSGGAGNYYQRSFMITSGMRSLDDAGLDISQGSFSAYPSTGKEGRIFIGADVPVANLSNPTPVGIYFFAANAADSVNNQLPTATALEMHLSSNPRALFSSSLHGTYQHLRNNPSTIYEPQDFIGTSTLNGLFFDDRYAHYGMSYNNAGNGQNRPVAWEFPTAPLTSLAQLQHVYFNTDHYEPSYAVGNSFASPYVRRDETISSVGPLNLARDLPRWIGSAIDFSYLLNDSLWDGHFFSSLAPTYEDGALDQDLDDTIDAFVTRTDVLQNSRMQLHLEEGGDAESLAVDLKNPNANPEQILAGHLMVEGAFNVNSVSVNAWKAFLGSLYAQDVVGLELGDSVGGGGAELELGANADQAVVSRFSLPTLDKSHPNGSNIQNNSGSGYRTLDATELNDLAIEIVKQVRARGPFLSLSEFVNRTLVASSAATAATGLMGPLQQAINDAGLNDDYALGLTVNKGGASPSANTHDVFLEPEAGTGNSYGAGPGYLLQGDLLNALGPFISVKSNTFMVRSYGESVNPVTGRQSSVYLEAIVQQVPEFVDTTNPVDIAIDDLNPENKSFGRQFNIVQVRRLTADEI